MANENRYDHSILDGMTENAIKEAACRYLGLMHKYWDAEAGGQEIVEDIVINEDPDLYPPDLLSAHKLFNERINAE